MCVFFVFFLWHFFLQNVSLYLTIMRLSHNSDFFLTILRTQKKSELWNINSFFAILWEKKNANKKCLTFFPEFWVYVSQYYLLFPQIFISQFCFLFFFFFFTIDSWNLAIFNFLLRIVSLYLLQLYLTIMSCCFSSELREECLNCKIKSHNYQFNFFIQWKLIYLIL